MVIFHSYASLPEGILYGEHDQPVNFQAPMGETTWNNHLFYRSSWFLSVRPGGFGPFGPKPRLTHLGMDQYLLIPFLVGWTSIYQLFWCSPGVQGFDTLPHLTHLIAGEECQALEARLRHRLAALSRADGCRAADANARKESDVGSGVSRFEAGKLGRNLVNNG